MENELKKLVYVDPEDPSVEYEIIVRGAEKALTALKDANGDTIHNTIIRGYDKERYNYVLVDVPENIKVANIEMARMIWKPSMNISAINPLPAIYKAKEETKLVGKVSLSS